MIFGIYNFNNFSKNTSLIRQSINAIKYHNQNGNFYIKKNIGLYCSDKKNQLFANKKNWIIYQGEIYNCLELKNELEKFGYQFDSNLDGEIVLCAYEKWVIRCQEKFNGEWAFVVWDDKKKQLFCSRDRFGLEPLYYFFNGKIFVFSSRAKVLFSCPVVKKELNKGVVFDYLTLNFIYHSRETFFQNIKQLEGGALFAFDAKGENIY